MNSLLLSTLRVGSRGKKWMNVAAFLSAALCSTPATTQAEELPANVISGQVNIVDRDGNDIADKSNVVIFVDGLSEKIIATSAKDPYLMSHKNRRFSPRVLPMVEGETLDFLNDDNIFHNVFSLSKTKPFDLGIYAEGESKLVTFPQQGLVKIYCNIHPDMISNILVLSNPYFAKTGADGTYEINNVPDGKFTLRVWHEFSDEIRREVSIGGGNRQVESFSIVAKKKIRQHKNKFGKAYKKKY